MKKLIALILIMAVLVPAAALADNERDPIVGSYYILFDSVLHSEFKESFGNNDLIVCVYSFMDDGRIIITENDIAGSDCTPINGVTGKWEKSGFKYTFSIVGFGTGEAYLKDNDIYLQMPKGYYMKLHALIPFDPYGDYVY